MITRCLKKVIAYSLVEKLLLLPISLMHFSQMIATTLPYIYVTQAPQDTTSYSLQRVYTKAWRISIHGETVLANPK